MIAGDEARRADGDVPELHEVDVPDELRDQIETAMAKYPQIRSASIPALWAVQRRYGWCSPDGIRQAAAVMGVTPAYLESVASFYDLLRTEPVGRHRVLVCTNISCWMNGGDELLDALLRGRRRRPARPRTAAQLRGRRALRVGLRVPRRLRHRADGLARRALLRAARAGRRGDGVDAAPLRRRRPARQAMSKRRSPAGPTPQAGPAGGEADVAAETRMLFRTSTSRGWRRSRATGASAATGRSRRPSREMEPERPARELEESGLRGRGGAGFSMGKKASLPAPRRDGQVPLLQRRRVRARHLQGPRADAEEPAPADRGHRDRRPRRRRRHPFIFIRGEYAEVADILDRAVAEAYDAGFLGDDVLGTGAAVELVVHRGAGAYICGEETALLDSLEGKRGNPRLKPPFPAIQGLYGGPTLINNVETLSNVPHIVNNGADWFKGFGTEQSPGTKVVSVSGCVQRPGNYEIELGIPSREIDRGPRRRPAGRAQGQGLVPGRLLRPGARPRPSSTFPTPSRRWPRPARCSAPARSSSPTTRSRSRSWRCGPRASTTTSPAASAPPAARARTGP